MNYKTIFIIPILLFTGFAAFANDYGAVRGIVHDPQHRPVQNVMVMLKAKSSDWVKSVTTDASGNSRSTPFRSVFIPSALPVKVSRKTRRI